MSEPHLSVRRSWPGRWRCCAGDGCRVTIGLHWRAAEAVQAYSTQAALTTGPLFRPRRNSRSLKLSNSGFHPATMHSLLQRYLMQLPEAMKEVVTPDGTVKRVCIYTPHSLRATAA